MVILTAARISFFGTQVIYPDIYGDERVWRNVSVAPFSEYAQSHDNKSPVFLLVNNVLQIQNTVLLTRLLNIAIYLFIVGFVYHKTHRRESFLILLFVVFNFPLILFDVAFEALFIILAMNYEKYSGYLVGLAGIFRPYAFLYTLVLKKEQRFKPLYLGVGLAAAMLATGGIFAYFTEVTGYGSDLNGGAAWIYQNPGTVYFFIVLLLSLIIISYSKSEYYKWGLLACIPLLLRTYEHYFLPPLIIFLFVYLMNKHENK